MTGKTPGIVVLGAGLAGLAAAYHGGAKVQVFEAKNRPGGECVTDQVDGFWFDRAGHVLHLQHPETRQWVERLLPKAWRSICREARIRLQGREYRYPFQANLNPLSVEQKAQAIMDYLSARTSPDKTPRTFKSWAQQTFGKTISALFMEPYNRKLWTIDPEQLTLAWMGNYMPKPPLERLIRGAFQDVMAGGGYNQNFLYPRQGGIEVLANRLAKDCPGLRLSSPAQALEVKRREVTIQGIGLIKWQELISTIPLPALVDLMKNPPSAVKEARKQLRANTVMVVNLGLRGQWQHQTHWMYFPESKYCFYRVGFPSNYGHVTPAGCCSLAAEVSLPAMPVAGNRSALVKQVLRHLQDAGIILPKDEIVTQHIQWLHPAYVIFDQQHESARRLILRYCEKQGIHCIGRWGHWEYSAMEDAMRQGQAVISRMTGRRTLKKA